MKPSTKIDKFDLIHYALLAAGKSIGFSSTQEHHNNLVYLYIFQLHPITQDVMGKPVKIEIPRKQYRAADIGKLATQIRDECILSN